MAAPTYWPTFTNLDALDTARSLTERHERGRWADGSTGTWTLWWAPQSGTLAAEADPDSVTRAGVMAVTCQRLPAWVAPPRWPAPVVVLADGMAHHEAHELLVAHEPDSDAPGALERLRDELEPWQPWRARWHNRRRSTLLAGRVAALGARRSLPELPAAEGDR